MKRTRNAERNNKVELDGNCFCSDAVSAPLRSVVFRCAPLRSVALRCAPLRSVTLRYAPLRSVTLRCAPLDNIGWVAHSIENIFGTNVNQTNILSGLDPEGMDTLVTIMRLLHRYLRPSMHRIDLLACSLAAYPQFQLFAQTIRLQSGVDLAASTNTTGTSNWILETHQIDVKDVYFTERINVYDSSLFGRFGRGALFRSAGPLVAQDTMSRIERNKGKPIGTGFETLGNDIKKKCSIC